jgi:hypothetical protein
MKTLKRRFIRCSAQATITHLKKFIAKKVLNGTEKYRDVSITIDAVSIVFKAVNHLPLNQRTISHLRFEVFTAVTMKNGVFWVVTSCASRKNRRFGGTWRLHQGDKNR